MKVHFAATLVLVLALPLVASAHDATPAVDANTDAAATVTSSPADKTQRRTWQFSPKKLRFRDKGPACMCVGGLTEKDIAAGRLPTPKSDLIDTPASTSSQADKTHE